MPSTVAIRARPKIADAHRAAQSQVRQRNADGLLAWLADQSGDGEADGRVRVGLIGAAVIEAGQAREGGKAVWNLVLDDRDGMRPDAVGVLSR